jgi:hypothetical protein
MKKKLKQLKSLSACQKSTAWSTTDYAAGRMMAMLLGMLLIMLLGMLGLVITMLAAC